MIRTSLSHPLQIAEVSPGAAHGMIGITFCPGKKQRGAFTGDWDRNLAIDLDAIAAWNAAAVATLLEDHEMSSLGVEGLGEAVRERHMGWYPLPIRDVSTPGKDFEQAWGQAGVELRAMLCAGFNVLVHCKGGLGRAGMTAARLLIELGMAAEEAVRLVRTARPGAIETRAQQDYVMKLAVLAEPLPDWSQAAREDRALGAMLGLAVGDALGTTLEFAARDSNPRIVDMTGGGPFRLKPGQWTDDTAMALALMDSLLADPDCDPGDLMARFDAWLHMGSYSCTGVCFDIGVTTRAAIGRWAATGNPLAGSTHPRSAGNGSLMRLAPVAIRHWQDRERLAKVAAQQSRTTHGAPEAVDACAVFAELLADAVAGQPRSKLLAPRSVAAAPAVAAISAGAWRGKPRRGIASSGYVVHSLEAALWCVGRTGSFADAVLLAANLGDDADTTAAITGQLAGALYGASAIPQPWRDQLAWSERITAQTKDLFAQGAAR